MQPRISLVDRYQFLFTRSASVLLGVAAVLSLGALILLHSDLTSNTLSFLNRRSLLVLGMVSAIGFVALFACMCNFWMSCDVSSKLIRAVWFAVLLLGCAYGSHIVYYAFVYLPTVAKRLRDPRGELSGIPATQDESRRRAIGPVGWGLIGGWGLFFLAIVAHFAFRSAVHRILFPILTAVLLWPVFMFVATVLYAIVSTFRAGMRRPAGI